MHSRLAKSPDGDRGARPAGDLLAPAPQSAAALFAGPKFGLPLVLMVIVAILFFVQPPISAIVRLPAEVRPSLSATLDIARSSFSASISHAIVGSGPATFLYEYLMHRSIALNATGFWGVRFSQGFSTISTLLVTLGVIGLLTLLFFFGLFVFTGFYGVASLGRRKSPAERVALISFVSFLFLFLSWFFYPANFTILLFTFLFAGMTLAALRSGGAMEGLEFSILKTPQRTFLSSLCIIILIVGVIVGIYWQGQKYLASVFHTIGVRSYSKNQNIDAAMKYVGLAVSLDQTRDTYWRTFAQLLSLRAQAVLSDKNLETAELQRRYQAVLQSLIQAGQRATQVNPRDPLNWRELASIYEDNIAIVGGADRFAVENYEKAAAFNPKNPAEYLNIAQAYVRGADMEQAQIARASQGKGTEVKKEDIAKLQEDLRGKLVKALENLQKAIELKSDYAPAYFLSSQVYERQGNRALAIQKTLETKNFNPLDTGVGYQLGLLYYFDNQTENARDEFVRVTGLNPDFANARYFLGLSYDRLGNKDKAIEQFERIQKLNPDNEEVKKILANLQAGKDALANIAPPGAAPQQRIETPEEEKGGESVEKLE
ncbi:MAG: tetratricopeptide repeat protein [Candidatus Spechtbacteria bacterium]|nr:tetratricopeptide repeat protein [Candidatus Spechtbacteria bacterium]